MQTCEPTNRNCIEGLACEASQHMMAKPLGTVSKVNAAVVRGKIMFLLGEICSTSGAGLTVKPSKATLEPGRAKRIGGCQPIASETDSETEEPVQRAAQQCMA